MPTTYLMRCFYIVDLVAVRAQNRFALSSYLVYDTVFNLVIARACFGCRAIEKYHTQTAVVCRKVVFQRHGCDAQVLLVGVLRGIEVLSPASNSFRPLQYLNHIFHHRGAIDYGSIDFRNGFRFSLYQLSL